MTVTAGTTRAPRVAILGAGFSGLCLGILLKGAGFSDFTIFEKAGGVGGTWRDNTYPGAACDLPSMAYCFSFEQKTDWSRKWSPQPEILEYMEHCARKYGLGPHLRFHTEISEARFDEARGCWRLRTRGGEEHEAEVLVSGVGQLSRPWVPPIPGLAEFAGESFHSARWNHDVDLTGKRVGVIGNAASAIQFIPHVARQAARLFVFQRSANWMLPRNDRAYSEAEKRRFTRFPWLAKLYRFAIWLQYESQFPLFRGNRFLGSRMEKLAIEEMKRQIHDPALQQALIPDYPIGGKRILISDDYYPALARENVEVVRDAIERVERDAVVLRGGRRVELDALILGTGFASTEFLAPMHVEGLGGRALEAAWSRGAEAYLGISVAGFPNFFLMYGPNTNLGHNSIIFMIECQARYILSCIRRLADQRLAWIDLRPGIQEAYNARIQDELSRTTWAKPDHSWYKTRDGRITNNWSGTTARYWWETRSVDFSVYREVPRAALAPPEAGAPTSVAAR